MSNTKEIVNRVAQSGLITLDLEELLSPPKIIPFDVKPYLFKELLLKEKDFRDSLKKHNWEQYRNQPLTVFCSTDAIIPRWAYMLVGVYASSIVKKLYFGTPEEAQKQYYDEQISQLNVKDYNGKRVIIKGCSEESIPPYVYVSITSKLVPIVKSLMYGEACSNVPLFKKKS